MEQNQQTKLFSHITASRTVGSKGFIDSTIECDSLRLEVIYSASIQFRGRIFQEYLMSCGRVKGSLKKLFFTLHVLVVSFTFALIG